MVRVFRHLLAVMSLLCLCAGSASANWMGGFVLGQGPTAHLGNLQHAGVQFDFKVTNANGARFVVMAYADGARLPDASWGGSSTYANGTTGTHANFITFDSGSHLVDQVVVRMFDPITSVVLLEMRLPVEYTFGVNAISNIRLSHTSPSWICNGHDLVIDFDYQTNEGAGARVSARPFTNGSLTPGYAASGVPLLLSGIGTGQQTFQFTSSTHDVDAVRFQMWNAAQTTLLLEFFVPVELHWGAVGISNITFNPPFPENLAATQPVTVAFDYVTNDALGCRVWAYAEGAAHEFLSGQSYAGSPVEAVSGHVSRTFQYNTGDDNAAFVRFTMYNHDSTVQLLKVTVPVAYHFSNEAIRDVVFTPASPAVLDNNERVNFTYNYVTTLVAGVRIAPTPYTYGIEPASSGVSGSAIHPVGSGSGTGFVTVMSGSSLVTEVGVDMFDSTWVGPINTALRETAFTFGGVGGVTATPDAVANTALVLGQNYPNPFNPLTNIPVDLKASSRVTVKLYDLRGRLVQTVADGVLPAGRTVLAFDGTKLASGEYFYVATSPDGSRARRMMLVK